MPEHEHPKPGESGERGLPGRHRADETPTAGGPPPRPTSGAPGSRDKGADPGSAQFFAPADAGPRPERIGPYRIIREIGDGGMGVVYLALREDEAFQRRVAIKIVKRGMDTEEVLRRFNLERQVLAALNHPNIARLIDGGATDDGRPYFVMEYVEGTPITDHCDAHRLTVDERLVLFRSVCAAVHYAHQNLVVHRDLKPGNILVTADGVPKLLDFGIAKLLNPALAARLIDPTGAELRLMTPEYASPEQARGDPITTASDVYTLGVLLYELLTGHRPYRLKSRIQQDVVRAICEEEPERPSTAVSRVEEVPAPTTGRSGEKPTTRTITPEGVGRARESHPDRLKRRLEGDLDNIVLMAMRKEPQRRYAGALDLAEDIGRHLSNHPVEARPDSPLYSAGKFVRRNRGSVAAAALVALSLVGGLGAALWQGEVASRQRGRADEAARLALDAKLRADQAAEDARREAQEAIRQKERAERASESTARLAQIMESFSSSLEEFQRSTRRRERLAEQTLDALKSLEEDRDLPSGVRRAIARAYIRLGDLQGAIRGPGSGRADAALECYKRAIALLREGDPATLAVPDGLAFAAALGRVGDALEASDTGAALEQCREALTTVQRLFDVGAKGPEVRRALARTMLDAGDLHAKMKQFSEADSLFERSLALRRGLLVESEDDPSSRRELAVGLDRMAGVHERAGRLPEALAAARESNALRAANLHNEPDLRRANRDLMIGQRKEATILGTIGDAKAARAALETAGETGERLAAGDPNDARVIRDLAAIYETLGDTCASLRDRAGAAAAFARMREAADKMAAIGHASALQFQASASARLGNVRLGAGDAKGALEAYQSSLDLYTKKASEDAANPDWQRNAVIMLKKLGDAYLAMGEAAQSESSYARALADLVELSKKAKDPSLYRTDEASARSLHAAALLELGRAADAKAEAGAAVALLDTKDGAVPARSFDRETLASALAALTLARLAAGETDALLPLAERAVALSARQDAFVLRALAGARFAAGDPPGAAQTANEALALVKDAPEGSPDAMERTKLKADLRRYETPR